MNELMSTAVPLAQLVGIAFAIYMIIRGEYVLTKLGLVLTAIACVAAALFVFELIAEWGNDELGTHAGWLVVAASFFVWAWFIALFSSRWLIVRGARRSDRLGSEYNGRPRRRRKISDEPRSPK